MVIMEKLPILVFTMVFCSQAVRPALLQVLISLENEKYSPMNCFLISPAEIEHLLQSLIKMLKPQKEKQNCTKLLFPMKMAQPA